MAPETLAAEYPCIESLVRVEAGEERSSVHVECARETSLRARKAAVEIKGTRRAAFFLEGEGGFDRDTVRSYLRFFARLAGRDKKAFEDALSRFCLEEVVRISVSKLSTEQRALLAFARMSLFEPELCFCERPLLDLGASSRSCVLDWIAERHEAGTVFVTVGQPLREALLMPGKAFWEEEGRLFAADTDGAERGDQDDLVDEVRVCKIAVKAGNAVLLLDPRDIDFIESANRVNYASVRGELYPTTRTMDELEHELCRFGFFRCHRSYIVNVQKVVRVERYTRNTFNLVLSDVVHTSLPLSKGRAEAMRERYGWK